MLLFGSVLLILGVAYAQYRNGLFTSVTMLMMVLLSGLVAFGFWEPLADGLERAFQQNLKWLAGCEDFLVILLLFSGTFLILRLVVQYLAPEMIEEHGTVQLLGGGAVGGVTGYFLAGFLICAMQTLPLDEQFLDFDPSGVSEPGFRNLMPPDRVWLSLMRQASGGPFRWKTDADGVPLAFDREATFELRYMRYRRTTETRPALPYLGEFDREVGRKKGGP